MTPSYKVPVPVPRYFSWVPVPVPRYFWKTMYLYLYMYLANSQVPVPVPRYYRLYLTPTLLSFNHGYHWRNGCPELNYVYPLWVNICLENAVKPQNNVPVWYVVLWLTGSPSTHFIHFAEHLTSRFNCYLLWATLGGEVRWGDLSIFTSEKN